jgi:hypothetical protein
MAAFALLAGPYMAAIGGLTRKKRTSIGLDAASPAAGADEALDATRAVWVGGVDVGSGEQVPWQEWIHEWIAGVSPLLGVVLLAGAGLVAWRGGRPRAADVALAACVGLYALLHVWLLGSAGYLSARHVWPVACLLLPWAAATVAAAWDARPARAPWAGRAVVVGVAILGLAVGASAAAWPWRAGRGYLRDAGRAIAAYAPTGQRILATDMRVPYYADGRPFLIGRTTLEALLAEARQRGIRFVAAESEVLRARVQGWREPPAPGAQRVAEFPVPSRAAGPEGAFVVWDLGSLTPGG